MLSSFGLVWFLSQLWGVSSLITSSGVFTVCILFTFFAFIPVVNAMPTGESAFPDITFKAFSSFIGEHFSSKTTLSTVLVMLFSLTENPDLLNLHARQQYVKCEGENRVAASGWIKGLARAVKKSIDQNQRKPLKMKMVDKDMDEEQGITAFSLKLDFFARLLNLHPYNHNKQFQGKLLPVSHKLIQPAHVICPNSLECETASCGSRLLLQITPTRDIPQVTLIKDSIIYDDVYVLTGQCPTCKTRYMADHERAVENRETREYSRVYLNSAKYLKIGQSLWVDRSFACGVLNGMYSFHASASAYTEYWNNSFWKNQHVKSKKISQRQVWQAFVQESIRSIASPIGSHLILRDGLAIDEVTKEAFACLGENGIIRAAGGHKCLECTHPYKKTSDIIAVSNSAATVGVDESGNVPDLQNVDEDLNPVSEEQHLPSESENMEVDGAYVTMAVLDGIVMGPPVCCKQAL